MNPTNTEESPTAIEVERALRSVQDADECKCGAPKCQGHEAVNGEIHIPNHPNGYLIVHNLPK